MLENTYGTTENENDWWYIFSLNLTKISAKKRSEYFEKYATLLARERIGDMAVHYRHCHEHTLAESRLPIGDKRATHQRFFSDILRLGGTNLKDLCAHCFSIDARTLDYSQRHSNEINKICDRYAEQYYSKETPTR